MTTLSPRWILAAFLVFGVFAADADACWWLHHCSCHRSHGSYSYRGAPSGAPSQAVQQPLQTTAAQAVVFQAPTFYYPTVAMQPAAAVTPQSGLAEVIAIIKLVKGVTGEIGGRGGTTTDLTDVRSSLARLEAGQKDLRSQLINNAGISQSIGEQLVKMNATLGAEGGIMTKLGEVLGRLPEPDATPDAAPLDAINPAGKAAQPDVVPKPDTLPAPELKLLQPEKDPSKKAAKASKDGSSANRLDSIEREVAGFRQQLERLDRIETVVLDIQRTLRGQRGLATAP